MPELPEVETMRRGILPIVGWQIVGVERPDCRRRPIEVVPAFPSFHRRVVDRRVSRVDRLGKRVVVVLDDGGRMILEPRMTGLVLLADPPTAEHVRWVARLRGPDDQTATLIYWDRRGLGSVRLCSEDEFTARYRSGRVGPDALEIDAATMRERLGSSRRAVKVALLDQQAIAGVGNLYASEILHLARIGPTRRCDRLTRGEWERIHAALGEVLRLAIQYEGSTLSDGTYRNALNQSGGFQNHHRVYDRAGEPCLDCATPIRRLVQAQRSTFYCPRCQRASAARGR